MCFPGSQSPVRRKYELCAFSLCVCARLLSAWPSQLWFRNKKWWNMQKYLRKHEEETLRKLQKHAETCQRIEETQWLQSEASSANRSGRKINRAQDWTTLCSLSAWAWCIFFTSLTRHGPKDVLRPFLLWALSKIYGELWHLLKSIEIYESPWGKMFLSASAVATWCTAWGIADIKLNLTSCRAQDIEAR